ncbi:MAG: DUF4230 domain-containing protein [Prevotella sp.]|nr:DUF4230 domain-containing protein [Prevotella sp.]
MIFLKFLKRSKSATIIMAIAALAFVLSLLFKCGGVDISTETDSNIHITPLQIQEIKDIGQWEFLSIENEELVDTIRKGFFSDDRLIRIYKGVLRLGIDLQKAQEGWVSIDGDTAKIELPPVQLLSDDYIDEAATQSLYESGSWSSKDRSALLNKAYQLMEARCMNEKNMKAAQSNAREQFTQLFKALGFGHVVVHFSVSDS